MTIHKYTVIAAGNTPESYFQIWLTQGNVIRNATASFDFQMEQRTQHGYPLSLFETFVQAYPNIQFTIRDKT